MNIQTVKFTDTSFINVTNPGLLEIKYLKKDFGFSSLHLDDYLNKTQIPKIEIQKNYSLLVLDFPYFNSTIPSSVNGEQNHKSKSPIFGILNPPSVSLPSVPFPQFPTPEKKRRVSSSQVDFFIGKNYLVTIHDESLAPINDIFSLCQKTLHNRDEFMGKGPVFLAYRIIDMLVDNCFPVINELSLSIDKIDKELEDKPSSNTIEDIFVTRRNIVVFHSMVKPLIPLFTELEAGRHKELNGEMQSFWGNILDHLQKILDRLEDNQELIEGISESNESLLSSRTNRIITVLTIFSAILLPLNLIASIYGMNIQGLPLAEMTFSFIIILLIMFFVGLFLLFVFKSRRWI